MRHTTTVTIPTTPHVFRNRTELQYGALAALNSVNSSEIPGRPQVGKTDGVEEGRCAVAERAGLEVSLGALAWLGNWDRQPG